MQSERQVLESWGAALPGSQHGSTAGLALAAVGSMPETADMARSMSSQADCAASAFTGATSMATTARRVKNRAITVRSLAFKHGAVMRIFTAPLLRRYRLKHSEDRHKDHHGKSEQ